MEQNFQSRVAPWLIECFGAMIAGDREERNHRFFEESAELVQSCGMTASEAHQLVDYVFNRPVGEKHQETGGVMVTLAALCLANDLDMHEAAETELARVWTKVEQIRAKQAAKPKHSPLPQAVEQDEQARIDDACIDTFAGVMKDKMTEQRAKGYDGWQGCGYQVLSNLLHRCVAKGDTRDVAIVAMMLHYHNAQIQPATDAWHPIATAPRDGTTIMLRFGQDGVAQGRYNHVPTNPGYPWVFIDKQDDDRWIINRAVDALGGPSHWMPMPGA